MHYTARSAACIMHCCGTSRVAVGLPLQQNANMPGFCCSCRGDAMTAAVCGGDAICSCFNSFCVHTVGMPSQLHASGARVLVQLACGCHGNRSLQMLHRICNASSCCTDVEPFQADSMNRHCLHKRKNRLSFRNIHGGQHLTQ